MWVLKWSVHKKSKAKKYYGIFWIQQFLFAKFPPSALDDLIVFSRLEKLTDHIRRWHLHLRTMPQNFRKISSGILELLHFLSLNNPTDRNAFRHFGWFSRTRSHVGNWTSMKIWRSICNTDCAIWHWNISGFLRDNVQYIVGWNCYFSSK